MTARTFTKRPVDIEAVQFTDCDSASTIIGWMLANDGVARYHEHLDLEAFPDGKGHPEQTEHLSIDTLEGTMTADVGDWIIRGVKGEFYPCKPDIFRATYEADDGLWCIGCGDLVLYDEHARLPDGAKYDAEGGAVCQACVGA